MKLVDILARELPIWPFYADKISQSFSGMIFFVPTGLKVEKIVRMQLADDWREAEVTRAKWQAAVDELKAEVRPTESMALHHQEVGRITRQWTCEGMPPAGIDVEVLHSGHEQWAVRHINYIGGPKGIVVFRGDVDAEFACPVISCQFRPIRTPEQISAEEIQKIRDEIKWQKPQLGPCPVEQMYLRGYRKFEIVDN